MKNKSQLYFGITFLLVFSLFFFNISSSEHDELLRTFSNAFHFPVFMMFGFFFLASYKSRGINWSLAKFKTFFLLTFLAIFIEIVQPYFGRSQSFRDFLTGVIGIVLSFPIYQAFQLKGRRRNLKEIFLLSFFSFSVFIVFLIPTLKQAYLLLDQKRAFPNLLIGSTYGLDICEEKKHLGIKAIFEPENYAWLGIDHENVCWRTLKGLNIDKNSNRFSGVEYLANGQNWSGYENLKLLILIDRQSEHKEINFNLRIDDDEDCTEYEQRFNRNFVLKPGENEIKIPLIDILNGPQTRKLNIKKIKRALLFIENIPENENFIVSQFYLD